MGPATESNAVSTHTVTLNFTYLRVKVPDIPASLV